jgi:hypothetical protein
VLQAALPLALKAKAVRTHALDAHLDSHLDDDDDDDDDDFNPSSPKRPCLEANGKGNRQVCTPTTGRPQEKGAASPVARPRDQAGSDASSRDLAPPNTLCPPLVNSAYAFAQRLGHQPEGTLAQVNWNACFRRARAASPPAIHPAPSHPRAVPHLHHGGRTHAD